MRERVFGVESEYAVIYHPGRNDRPRPTNLTLYRRFEGGLLRRVQSLPNAFSPLRWKMGRFLENGGTFHYEANEQDLEDGLIEMASPECRDPLTLLCYERAKDELVEELSRGVNAELELAGYTGRVAIGKNNVDSAGNTFGSHENYWVEDRLSGRRLALFAPVWLATWTVSALPLLWVFAVLFAVLAGLLAFGVTLVGVALVLTLVRPRVARHFSRWTQRMGARLDSRQADMTRWLRRLLRPVDAIVALHSRVYERFHFLPLRRDLSAFLATRIVWSGAGVVSFDGGPIFALSQRAGFLRRLCGISTDGERRPVFELRDLFFRPWSAFAARRRLHLMCGDANLCEWAQHLRFGATSLVIEAIESGADVGGWPHFADAIGAMRSVSADPGLRRELQLADGRLATALEVQRRYLRGVRQALGDADALAPWKARVLRDWDETLRELERDPDALADRVDWIAKRALLRRIVPDPADWRILEARGRELVGPGRAGPGGDASDVRLRDLAFRLWREDLRYHELGPRGGYRRLEARGRVRRLSDPERVHRARRRPPSDTRAWQRGTAIRRAQENARSGAAAWHRVRVGKFGWQFFPDPLDAGHPRAGDGRADDSDPDLC
ncbi:MAG: proteasome accessory factor PafA2 family protein [Deltaproteobacteria bacterium]|nr:proteasome accessory factor PafA2 family protein [Deltaproteobacteria bacterium]MBW2414795.1 proteasome accessory factor PafA2 family protein [Deltaproteobacteria bacterium]